MINTTIIKQNILDDLKPSLFIKYLLFNELIIMDISFKIIDIVFNISDEIMIYKQDVITVRYHEILTLKLISSILKEYIDLTEYGLSSLFDKQTNFQLLKELEKISGQKFEYNLNDGEDEEYSNDLENYMSSKFKEYNMKYSGVLDHSKKITMDGLKTDKKYLIGM